MTTRSIFEYDINLQGITTLALPSGAVPLSARVLSSGEIKMYVLQEPIENVEMRNFIVHRAGEFFMTNVEFVDSFGRGLEYLHLFEVKDIIF